MAERVSVSGTAVSPRLFANYRLGPGHVLRGGVSTATRAPTLFETFGQPRETVALGNPELDRERITAYELGYFGQIPRFGVQADLRIFDERLKDLISTAAVPPSRRVSGQVISTCDNVDTARIRGVSYEIRWAPFASTRLNLAQALVDISQRDLEVEQSAPRHSTSLMWTQQLPGSFSFSLIHYAVSEMRWLGFGSLIPAHRRTDVRFGYAFRAAGMRGELSLVGQNVLDDYYEFRIGSEPQTHLSGSRAYASLRLEF